MPDVALAFGCLADAELLASHVIAHPRRLCPRSHTELKKLLDDIAQFTRQDNEMTRKAAVSELTKLR